MMKVLVAGATGYLGKYLCVELKKQGYHTTALLRNNKLDEELYDEIIEAEVTKPDTLIGICNNIDFIISTVGITKQKDGLTYMDVDFQANMNLLREAQKAGVSKFIYVSVLNGFDLRHLKMVEAKERFVSELKASDIKYQIIRPNGFFSDMTEVLDMANKGTVYLFGNGEYKGNPIHGEDLAEFMVQHLDSEETELEVGGPDLLTQNEIARVAFEAAGRPPKISHIPIWIRNLTLGLIRFFSGQKVYGPIEFFMTVMTMDMVARQVGQHHLSDYYKIKAGGEQLVSS